MAQTKHKLIIGILLATTLVSIAITGGLGWLVWNEVLYGSQKLSASDSRLPTLMKPAQETAEETLPERYEDCTLYFLQDNRQFLQQEIRSLPFSEHLQDRLHTVVYALIEGPRSETALPIFPRSTRVLAIHWYSDEGLVVVNFSPDLLTDHPGQLFSEWGTVFGLTNTIVAQDPDRIRQVQILIDGKIVDRADTVLDWSMPFEPDQTFVAVPEPRNTPK